ncbi:MAG: hypothetical protein OEQ12_05925, partial [Nitrosopumilus sp.]|nr:hypothetical protein [Nitrosopumilus sp.]
MIKKEKTVIYSSVENSQPEKCILNKQFFLSPPVDNKSISLFMKELKKIQNSIVFDKSFPELFYYDYISLWWPFYQD